MFPKTTEDLPYIKRKEHERCVLRESVMLKMLLKKRLQDKGFFDNQTLRGTALTRATGLRADSVRRYFQHDFRERGRGGYLTQADLLKLCEFCDVEASLSLKIV